MHPSLMVKRLILLALAKKPKKPPKIAHVLIPKFDT